MHVSPLRGDSAELFGNNKVWVASPALPLLSSAEDLGASYAKINTKSHSQSNFSVPQVPRHHRDSSHDLFMWRGVHFCFSFCFALLWWRNCSLFLFFQGFSMFFFFNLFLLIGREISNEVGSLEIHCMFTLPTLVFEYKQLKKKKECRVIVVQTQMP